MSWKFIENIANMNVVGLIKSVLKEKATEDFLINLNTDVQLFENNENSLGIKLYTIGGEYTNRTLSLSSKKGSKNIDLFDTGEFYSTFIVAIHGNGDFEIFADDTKTDEFGNVSHLKDRWGKDITGLTIDSHDKAIKFIEKRSLQILCK